MIYGFLEMNIVPALLTQTVHPEIKIGFAQIIKNLIIEWKIFDRFF